MQVCTAAPATRNTRRKVHVHPSMKPRDVPRMSLTTICGSSAPAPYPSPCSQPHPDLSLSPIGTPQARPHHESKRRPSLSPSYSPSHRLRLSLKPSPNLSLRSTSVLAPALVQVLVRIPAVVSTSDLAASLSFSPRPRSSPSSSSNLDPSCKAGPSPSSSFSTNPRSRHRPTSSSDGNSIPNDSPSHCRCLNLTPVLHTPTSSLGPDPNDSFSHNNHNPISSSYSSSTIA